MLDVLALLRTAGFTGDGVELRSVAGTDQLRGTTVRALATEPGVLADAVDEYADMHQQQFGPSASRHLAALWLLQDVAWIHAALAVGLIAAHGISLRPPADALAMQLPRDMFFEVQVVGANFDTVVALGANERSELYRSGRRYLAELLDGLREPIRPHLRAGAHAFWACVTDMATGAISTGARGEQETLRSALTSFDDQTPPLLSGERLVVSPAGPIRRRHGCCLLYTIESMSVCFSCPRITDVVG